MSLLKFIVAGLYCMLIISCSDITNRTSKEKVYEYDYVNGKLSEKFLYEENEYDTNDNLISQVNYTEEGEIDDIIKYSYDESGNVLSYRKYNENGYVTSQTTYRYDRSSNLILMIYSLEGQIVQKDSFIYQNEAIIEKWILHYQKSNTYDLAGRIIYDSTMRALKQYYNNSGNHYVEYAYNETGKLVEEIVYSNGDKGSETYYTYDKNGRKIEEICFSSGYTNFHFVYEYDSEGREIRSECIESSPYVCTTEYDKRGRVIYETETRIGYLSGDNEKFVYKHRYTCR